MTAGVPFPPNPPEQIIEQLRDEADPFGWTVPLTSAEAAVRAADSWWRSRLVSDETREAVAAAIVGQVGFCSRATLDAALAALLPVAEKPHVEPEHVHADDCPACVEAAKTTINTAVGAALWKPPEKPETDT